MRFVCLFLFVFYNKPKSASERTSERVFVLRDTSRQLRGTQKRGQWLSVVKVCVFMCISLLHFRQFWLTTEEDSGSRLSEVQN